MDEIKELQKYEFEFYAWNKFLGSKKDKFGLKRWCEHFSFRKSSIDEIISNYIELDLIEIR